MAMTPDQIDAELRRKAALGIQPTNQSNKAKYDEIRAAIGQTQPQVTTQTNNKPSFWGNLARGVGGAAKTAYSAYTNATKPNTATPAQPTNRFDDIYNEIGNIRSQLTQERTPFEYDPDDDPQYQAALRQARRNAQTASNNAMVSLGSRGIGNSQSAVSAANQIEQREYANVSDNILPQLMSQAYQRYSADQNAQRQAILDQLGLAQTQYGMTSDADARQFRDTSYADQRSDVLYNREDKAKQDRLALANYLSQQFGVQVDPKMDTNLVYEQVRGLQPLNARQFEEGIRQFDQNYERGVFESDRSFNRDVLESNRSFGLQREREDRLSSEGSNGATAQMDEERRGLVSAIRSGQITPGQALAQIEEDLALGFYTPEQAALLKQDLSTISRNAPQPEATPETQRAEEDYTANLPSDKEIEAEARRFGYPTLEYRSYMKDPRGKMSGSTFEQWKSLYGPRLTAN